MKNKIDIESVEDIKIMVNSFYEKVKKNEILNPYFKNIDWNKHLPTMYKFWNNIAFCDGEYIGNPMEVHKRIHEKNPLFEIVFENWLTLFLKNIDSLFKGNVTEQIKLRASNIARVMVLKILN